jgi:hypothetical protein
MTGTRSMLFCKILTSLMLPTLTFTLVHVDISIGVVDQNQVFLRACSRTRDVACLVGVFFVQ